MKTIATVFFITACISFNLFSQNHLSLDVNDPIYTLLEIAEIKGSLARVSSAKPLSRSTIISYLTSARASTEIMLISENAIIDQILERLTGQQKMVFRPAFSDEGYLGYVEAGINQESDVNFNFNNLSAWHMFNALWFYLKGDIGVFFSYYGCFAGTFDKVSPDSFAPYSFTKQWDGFHIGFTEPRYSLTGIEANPYFSFIIEDETTAKFFDDHLTLSFSRYRRDWGMGEGNLYLSGSARPYQGFDINARFASWCNFSWTTGSLNDWRKENQLIGSSGPEKLSYQKMATIQMLEFFPTDWFYLSTVATAIWGKRFELVYLSPLLYPVIAQNTIGNFDNVAQAVNVMFFIPGYAKLFFSFFADEMEFTSLDKFFTRPRNMVAYQAGLKLAVPWISFTLLTIQYTKIEPFVYAHYPESNLEPLGHPVDMSYTNDGENLGYHIPPNSDEILIKAESMFVPDLMLSLSYSLIRHGTNGDPKTQYFIYGDVDIPFDYNAVDLYPDKAFLNDGKYDWNNIISIGATYVLPEYNLTFSIGYTFTYTFSVPNSSGMVAPLDQYRNIVSLGVSFAR